MIKRRFWQSWFLAVLLSLGFMMVWAIVVLVVTNYGSRSEYRYIVIPKDGRPVVRVYPAGFYGSATYENLDGTAAKKPDGWLQAFWRDSPRRRASGFPLSWRHRLLQIDETEDRSGKVWFLFHDGEIDGNAYFVVYDRPSRTRVGYFGRAGFQKTKPTVEESFPIRGSMGLFRAVVGSEVYAWRGLSCYGSESDASTAPNIVYLLSADGLLRVDLQKRSIDVLREAEGISAICGFYPSWFKKDASEEGLFGDGVLLARTETDLLVLDADGKVVRRFVIPPTLAGKQAEFYALGKTQLLAKYGGQHFLSSAEEYVFVWFDDAGNVMQEELARWPADPSTAKTVGISAAAVPAPVVFTPVALLRNASISVRCGKSPDFSSALAASFAQFWPAVLFVSGVGVLCAWICYRRQKRYDQPWTRLWVVTVFLFGLPGLVGYLAHRRWPPLETCPNCTVDAPRDRETCYLCGEEFPRPALKGTEVFA